MAKCSFCSQRFESKSSLIRHISHKSVCKAHYGEEKFEDMRFQSRLQSKRDWKQKNSQKYKQQYKEKKEQIKSVAKKRYVSKYIRESDEGLLFSKLYSKVYDMIEEETLYGKKFQDIAYDAIFQSAFDKSIDSAMTSSEYPNSFLSTYTMNQPSDAHEMEFQTKEEQENYISKEVEKALEMSFDKFLKSTIKKDMEEWIEDQTLKIGLKCFDQGKRTAFTNLFEAFKTTVYPKLQDFAFDAVIIDIEQIGKDIERREFEHFELDNVIEILLSRGYKKNLDSQIEELPRENEFSKRLEEMITQMLKKQVSKINANVDLPLN